MRNEQSLNTRTAQKTKMDNPFICLVVPMFNAANTIGRVLEAIPEFIQHIIVVDDGSTDTSANEVLQTPNPRVELLRLERNSGVGSAMLIGYQRALDLGATVVVKIDADDQMDPAYLARIISPIISGQADYTKGNRFLHNRQLSSMPLMRRFGNIGLSFMTKMASGYWNIFDPTNGYTAIHAASLREINRERINPRFFFETSMLIELGIIRAVVRDVCIPARYRGESSRLSKFKSLLTFPPRLIRALCRRLWVQYMIMDFGPVSAFLLFAGLFIAFGLIFGTVHWVRSAQIGTATPTGTIMIAMLPLILGTQFLLQAIVLDIQNVPTTCMQSDTPKETFLQTSSIPEKESE